MKTLKNGLFLEQKVKFGLVPLCVLRVLTWRRRLPSISMVGSFLLFHAEDNAIELVIPDIPVDEGEIKEMNLNLIRVVNKAGAATCTAEDFQFFGRQITVTGFSLTENEGRTWEAVQELPIGGKIRIEGNGLKTANELYINGTSVDLTGIPAEEKNDAFLIVTIPETLPFGNAVENPDSRNKMRLDDGL